MRFSWMFSSLRLRKLSRGERRSLKRQRTYVPLRVERLEDRLAPTVDTWTGGAGTLNWTDAANWSAGVPTSTQDVQINTAVAGPIAVNITNPVNRSIHSLTDTTASLSVTGGSLKIAADSSMSTNLTVAGGSLTASGQLTVGGTFTQSGGTFTGTGTLTVTGQTVWTGGTMSGSGTTIAAGGLQLGTADGNYHEEDLSGRTLENAGNAVWQGTASAGGYFRQRNDSTFENLAGATLDIQTDLEWSNDNGNSTFINQGTVKKSASTGTTYFDVAFSNPGTLDIESGALDLQGELSNFSGNTLSGGTYIVHSTLQFNGAAIQTNDANIVLDGAASGLIDQSGKDALASFTTNEAAGSFTIADGRNFSTSAPLTNSGTVTIGSGTTFTAPSYTQNGGTTQLAGGALTTNGGVSIASGTLTGNGTVTGNVSDGGAVAPGSSTTPGKLTIDGSYTQTAGGALDTKIAGRNTPGTDYDQLVVRGAASLGGSINVSILNGFTAQSGDQYQIMTFASSSGDFATKNGFYLGDGNVLSEQFSSSNLALVVNQARLRFLTEPSNSVAGQQINPGNPVQVEVLDGNGNLVQSDNTDTIALTLNQNSFDPASKVTATVSGGIATFDDLIIDKASSGYQITASNPILGSVVSAPLFNVTPDVPAKLVFTAQPSSSVHVGDTLSSVQVQVEDRENNLETGYNGSVTLSLSSNLSALGGTDPQTVSGGIATFGDLTVSKAGSYQLVATSGTLPSQSSTSFTVNPLDTSVTVNSVSPGSLILSANPQTINLTSQVSSLDNAFPINEGTVSFTVDDPNNNPVGQPVVSNTVSDGSASTTFTLPGNINAPTGTYTVTATYAPGTEFLGSVTTSSSNGAFILYPLPVALSRSAIDRDGLCQRSRHDCARGRRAACGIRPIGDRDRG